MNKKTRNIITFVYTLVLIALLAGATFSFFTVINVASVSPKVETSTATLDYILFDTGNDISIYPNESNFKVGMDSLSSSTYASAYLKHSEGNTAASIKYNVILNIETNTLEYSAEQPELILQVTDNDGNAITKIDDLEYVTTTDGKNQTISGFDITTKKGQFYIQKLRSLQTSSEILEKWNIKVIFVNLGESQNKNLNKELKGTVQVEKAA